jgi:hypothetical protein
VLSSKRKTRKQHTCHSKVPDHSTSLPLGCAAWWVKFSLPCWVFLHESTSLLWCCMHDPSRGHQLSLLHIHHRWAAST